MIKREKKMTMLKSPVLFGSSSMTTFLLCFFLLLCSFINLTTATKQSLDSIKDEEQTDQSNDEDRRATWLETRNLEGTFKKLVYLSLQELVAEGRVDEGVLTEKVPRSKRGRHQGFCFRKSKTGRFLPYICWKGEGSNEEKK